MRGDDQDEIRRYWDALAKDATIKAPLEQSGWSLLYGMLTDKFGVTWVLDVLPPFNA